MEYFSFEISEFKIKIDDIVGWRDFLKRKNGKRGILTVEEIFKQRTNRQNAFYHGVAIPILIEVTGYTHDEMHGAMKYMFLRTDVEGMPPKIGSTKNLKTIEFEEYLEDIRTWAFRDLNTVIPLPNEGI